ncbi:MAG: serine/threonine-protein kinase [Myxococcota bacterium]
MAAEDDVETLVPSAAARPPADSNATLQGSTQDTGAGEARPAYRRQPRVEPGPGDTIGPFTVDKVLGRGAMGLVVRARDAELDRDVAIKLLTGDDRDPVARARLLREAQSAAGLSHPNVVAVHQIGTHDGQVYVVMEAVDGGTLGEWIEHEPRSWREVVDVYLQAGEGLAAAHRHGLVHRDFKPDNVLIGTDGRVRVSDFGLVGRADDRPEVTSTVQADDELATRLTRTGAIMGTPAYMAMEQLAGERADARSDQFSYCVAFFEALWRRRPYPGDTITAIFAAIAEGELDEPPPDDVPASVREALLKGLAAKPKDRHESVDLLLEALRRHRAHRLRRGPVVAAGLALLGVGAGATYWLRPAPTAAQARHCDDGAERYDGAWGPKRRAAAELRFETKPNGAVAFALLDAEMNARRDEWVAGTGAACEAWKSGAEEPGAYALRIGCLDTRLAEARRFTELVLSDDDRLLDGAVSMSTALLPIAACEDVATLQAAPSLAAGQSARLAPIRSELARARLLVFAGHYLDALDLVEGQLAALLDVGYEAEVGAALETQARIELALGRNEDAAATARETIGRTVEARDGPTEARAIGTLIAALQLLGRHDEAAGMVVRGRAAAERSPDVRAAAYLEAAIATLHAATGATNEATAGFSRAIALLEGLRRPPPDALAGAYMSRARIKLQAQNTKEGFADLERGVAIATKGLGPHHPFSRGFSLELDAALQAHGQQAEAPALHRRALADCDETHGKDDPTCAAILQRIGNAHLFAGELGAADEAFVDGVARHDRASRSDPNGLLGLVASVGHTKSELGEWGAASAAYERARQLATQIGGTKDARLTNYDVASASVLASQDRYAESLVFLEQSHARLVEWYGPRHPEVAMAAALIGDTHARMGDCATAMEHYGEATQIRSALAMPPDGGLVHLLLGVGDCQIVDGELEAGRTAIDEVAKLAAGADDDLFVARLEFAQARLAWHDGDRERARSLATAASRRLANAKLPYRNRAAPIDAWLADHND